MNEIHTRRTYHILAVIGQGGFGTVYRATMEGQDGFRKDVAIKLMHEGGGAEGGAAESVKRFRDEARMLGLVRDRAIVSVDPPTHLNGRLAVVMEYVDGASAAALVHQNAFPPSVALEVVQEVARVLDKVVRHPGPDGRPLNLLHRDLKPANLQITPGGEVKVLDFGIARATFDRREARTTSDVAGTIGYIAPERLSGVEVPAGDVYSLGVLLHVLLTRDKALTHAVFEERGVQVARTAAVCAALALAAEMCHLTPAARPTARQVEDRCQYLRQLYPSLTLRAWAETHVPPGTTMAADELVGVTLSETIAVTSKGAVPGAAEPTTPMRGPRVPARTGFRANAAVLALGMLGVVVLGTTGFGWALSVNPTGAAPVLVPIVEDQSPLEVFAADVAAEPAPSPVAVPAVRAPLPAPQTDDERVALHVVASVEPPNAAPARIGPQPLLASDPPAAPAAAALTAPASSPAEREPTMAVTFASVPGGAAVWVDGLAIGTAPVVNYQLSIGSFTVRMVSPNGESIVRTIQTGSRAPTRYVWDQLGGGTWNSY